MPNGTGLQAGRWRVRDVEVVDRSVSFFVAHF
jgi:hypothetical protein